MYAKVEMGSRYLLGLLLLVSGINGFLNLFPNPEMSLKATALMTAFGMSGYMFPAIKLVEILVGLALLSNKFVPLALIIFAPINLNIFLIHACLDPKGLPIAIILIVFQGILTKKHWAAYSSLLKA